MESLYTNSRIRHDFFKNAFISIGETQCDILIAVAFFTNSEVLIDLVNRGCRVKLIVRLGYPTNPTALQDILGREGIQIRFVNDRSFHPKLYIFTGHCAIAGSSNLTESALLTNQEVNVSVDIEDPRYSELISLFAEWWDQSKVLDNSSLDEYRNIYEKYRKHLGTDTLIEDDLQKKQGRITIKNIERGLKTPSASEIYLDDYKSIYQGFLDAYLTVERIYKGTDKRKYDDSIYPLRLEIDSYFSFVRETKTVGDSYKDEPLLKGQQLV
jgi:HKD family nuclease